MSSASRRRPTSRPEPRWAMWARSTSWWRTAAAAASWEVCRSVSSPPIDRRWPSLHRRLRIYTGALGITQPTDPDGDKTDGDRPGPATRPGALRRHHDPNRRPAPAGAIAGAWSTFRSRASTGRRAPFSIWSMTAAAAGQRAHSISTSWIPPKRWHRWRRRRYGSGFGRAAVWRTWKPFSGSTRIRTWPRRRSGGATSCSAET